VNTSAKAQDLSIDLKGSKLQSKGTIITLASSDLNDENSFANPKKLSPKESDYTLKGEKAPLKVPAYSVTVLKLKIK
jgi:alpha-L-arabinofuranosidase